MVMEAEKSPYLQSTNWRPRKAVGVVQSKSEGLRTRGASGVTPRSRSGEDEIRCPNSSGGEKKKKRKFFRKERGLTLFCTCCAIEALKGLGDAHTPWEGRYTLLSPLIQMLVSLENALIETLRNSA